MIELLRLVHIILSHYMWIVPVAVGVPGNIMAAAIATKKHNRGLSACAYMTGMALADTGLLLHVAWTLPLLYTTLGLHIVVGREFLFK